MVLGDLSLDGVGPTAQTIKVEEVIIHENYRETPAAVHNDIGDPCLSFLFYIK